MALYSFFSGPSQAIEKLLKENNFIHSFYKRKRRGHRGRLLGLGEGEEGKKEEIPLDWTTGGGLEAPTIEDPRWSLEVGQNLQATAARTPRRHSLGTEALGLSRGPSSQNCRAPSALSFQALGRLRQRANQCGKRKGGPSPKASVPSSPLQICHDLVAKTGREGPYTDR